MFITDLLKGQGIPIKSKPGGAALMGISFAIPVVIIMIMFANYLHGHIVLSTRERLIGNYEARMDKLAAHLKFQENAECEIDNLNACLQEVADTITQHIQWSPVLQVLAANMPESLVLEELHVETATGLTKKVPKRDDPSKYITITLPKRILRISLYRKLRSGGDEAVLQLQQKLRNSSVLSPIVDTIRPVSQEADEKEGLMRYEIECIFEPG